MIIAISGKIGSGKDTVGNIIQLLTSKNDLVPILEVKKTEEILRQYNYCEQNKLWDTLVIKNSTNWETKKFGGKLKDIVCLLLNCTREQLEDRGFKEKELGEEWQQDWQFRDKWLTTIHKKAWNKEFKRNSHTMSYNEIQDFANSLGWNDGKLTPRLLLQIIGTECGRNIIHPNIWVNALMSEYKEKVTTESFYNDKANNYTGITNKSTTTLPNWIITDMRFPNELKSVKDRGGITIRINRPDENGMPIKSGQHLSETALDNAEFDYVIDNNGTIEELIVKVKSILNKEKLC